MKKLFLLVLSVVMISTGSFAQDKKKAGKGDAPKQTEAAPANAPKTKKDGTPDMRYKENKAKKEEAAPAGPTKKDGTPDKRYKANKDAGPAKK